MRGLQLVANAIGSRLTLITETFEKIAEAEIEQKSNLKKTSGKQSLKLRVHVMVHRVDIWQELKHSCFCSHSQHYFFKLTLAQPL